MSDLKNKRIITAAVTGAWPTRQDNPALPVTPEEIAEDVYECWKAGAAVAHIHVRNDDGTPCTDFERYKETIDLIRAKKDCDICINITSSGGTLGNRQPTDWPRFEAGPWSLPNPPGCQNRHCSEN